MANQVKITSSFGIECGGYTGEGLWSYPATIDKTTTATSGTEWLTYVFHNSCNGKDTQSQQIKIIMHCNWSVSYDEYANMTVKIHSYVDNVTAVKRGAGAGCGNQLLFLKVGFGSGNLPYNITYRANTYGQIGGAGDLGEITFTIPSGSTASRQTLYVFNGWDRHQGDNCSIYVDRMKGGLTFSNPNAIIRVNPTITPFCRATGANTAQIGATIDYKNGNGTNKYTYCVSTRSDFASCTKSGSGNGNANIALYGLQPNTRYYVRWTAENGYKGSTATCSFVTIATNNISRVNVVDYNNAKVSVVVQNGGAAYPPSTVLQYKKCSDNTWSNFGTTNTTSVATLNLGGLDPETCYQVRAVTTTTAGQYVGNVVSFETPNKALNVATITNIDVTMDEKTYDICANICYKWETGEVPSPMTLYYRVKDGYDKTIYEVKLPDATTKTGTGCIEVCDLYSNQTVYETWIRTWTSQSEYTSDIEEFITPVIPEPELHNCENFDYLTDLFCQAVVALADGDKEIYANDCSKELCDPDSANPTLLSIMSRGLRMFHAMECLLCDMGSARISASKPGQYLVGQAGWQDIITEIVDGADDSWKIATSDAVYQYIKEKLHEVWHYHEAVDILVLNLVDLDDYPDADSAIVTNENKIYRKVNGTWVASTDPNDVIDNMGVWHINMDSDTQAGVIKAGSAWYYWEDNWQPMDADVVALEKLVKEMWDNRNRVAVNEAGVAKLHINTVDKAGWSCGNYPASERWVTFITESMTQPAPVYHTVTFTITLDDDDWMSNVQPQQVIDGGTAQMPTTPNGDCDFIRWEDINNPGTAFNFNTVIKKDYNLVAQLDCGDYITTESSVIITAENGDKFVK